MPFPSNRVVSSGSPLTNTICGCSGGITEIYILPKANLVTSTISPDTNLAPDTDAVVTGLTISAVVNMNTWQPVLFNKHGEGGLNEVGTRSDNYSTFSWLTQFTFGVNGVSARQLNIQQDLINNCEYIVLFYTNCGTAFIAFDMVIKEIKNTINIIVTGKNESTYMFEQQGSRSIFPTTILSSSLLKATI